MRKLLAIGYLCLFGLCLTNPALAQLDRNEIQVVRAIWGAEKKDIVGQYMKFHEAEAAKFWPLYEIYTAERRTLGTDRIDIISDYARTYQTMTDAQANNLANRLFRNDLALDKLQKKYYGKFKKVISPLRASQFMQLESYLDTAIKAELQSEIPMIGELRRKK